MKTKFELFLDGLKEDGAVELAAKIVSIKKVVCPFMDDDEFFAVFRDSYTEFKRDQVN